MNRFYAVLSQMGLRVCELHGNVSQTMRYTALQKFRDNEVDVMVCTDVAARGMVHCTVLYCTIPCLCYKYYTLCYK
jgi:late competence protein required for DNA uptake (superfamily II DNA/RNA helicase)